MVPWRGPQIKTTCGIGCGPLKAKKIHLPEKFPKLSFSFIFVAISKKIGGCETSSLEVTGTQSKKNQVKIYPTETVSLIQASQIHVI